MHIGMNLLRKVQQFQNMTEKEIETVAKALVRGSYQDGDYIIKQAHMSSFHLLVTFERNISLFIFVQGGSADKFYIVEKGFAKIVRDGNEVQFSIFASFIRSVADSPFLHSDCSSWSWNICRRSVSFKS
jgi:hypothetical protein